MKKMFFAFLAAQMFAVSAHADSCSLLVKEPNDKGVIIVKEQVPFLAQPSGADTLVLQATTYEGVVVTIVLDEDLLITTFKNEFYPNGLTWTRGGVKNIREANGSAVGIEQKSWEISCP